ncbi:DNA mismatch repair protein MSH6 isoform X2 [Prosopis cineraria]|uniref:DNA mismatch repair protein MSH6 isoform X2 n=1 Tax=Prosopis cineraria TaxID=364024 RepID=UPI00240F3739|nr:DNA mismatch repair protein MSH6 isoform X2 [Prosopis cineraria]
MSSSRRQSNGRSPLVNPQRQITSFFSKTTSSPPSFPAQQKANPNPSPPSILSKQKLSPSRITDRKSSPSPSPSTPSPSPPNPRCNKPLLLIGTSSPHSPSRPTPSSSPPLDSLPYGQEVVGRRIKVYWPLDKTWYEGCVGSFDKHTGKHLVLYDDDEEESLDLAKEKIEWVQETVKKFKRLRRGFCASKQMVIEDEGAENAGVREEEGSGDDGHDDDSSDDDWGKNEIADDAEDSDEDMELKDEEDVAERPKAKGGKKFEPTKPTKRKPSGGEKRGPAKKSKIAVEFGKGSFKVSMPEQKSNSDSKKAINEIGCVATGDAPERFAAREAEKLHFLRVNRKDARRRRPGDENYDPKTLYLPPDFLKSLSDGQKQWWEFKSKHMDKVLFFKMGKFYELFEMDAHVGVKELDLQYMKGEQPHCGFPEKNFSMNVEKLAGKGYRILVVEQTETPEQLEIRRKKGSKDKVVKREICAVVTKGTLTDGELLSVNPEASYLMALTECHESKEDESLERIYGVCVVDVATSRVILGQFEDDSECSALCSILSELRPVEIIKPAKLLSAETERVLRKHTRNPLVNELVPNVEFWDAEKAFIELKRFYSNSGLSSVEGDGIGGMPDVLLEMVRAVDDNRSALSALGGALYYLKQAFLDESLLRFAQFEILPFSNFDGLASKPYMVLDAAALENLEIFENSRNGDSSGTLYAQLNQCVTAFGKRLLKTWLARPLYHLEKIKERQEAVAGLRGVNLPSSLEFRKALSRLPDMERLLACIFSSSEASGRNANKVVLYEDAAKKQLQQFVSALRGCELMARACSLLHVILNNNESRQLHHLLTPGEGLPDVHTLLDHFKDAFDWDEANNSGRILPHKGVDSEYDSACKMVDEIESSLLQHLKEQRKFLRDNSITYVSVGKEAYLLEVPESLSGNIPQDYEMRSSRKGFFRYWTPDIKKLLGKLSQGEQEKESSLKTILQRLVCRFCEHHTKWRQLVSATAELDALISLAIAGDYYEGSICQPRFLGSLCTKETPCLSAKGLGHPVLGSDYLGKGAFVPNDITIGGPRQASFILLTGPNMGGKSTLLRQVCLAVILAQVGADVPAKSFDLSPVDRIFVRMGAKDNIMADQSTFLTELSETATVLSSATRNSLVALDELGRGTSTSDGQAIAESVLEYLVQKVQCRGLFSTHYHLLAVDFHKDPKVSLCHMACQVGDGVGGVDEVTFLYRLTPGACPKSYGVNVARLAGLPTSVLQKAAAKSREFEAKYGKHRKASLENNASNQSLADKMAVIIQKLINATTNLNILENLSDSFLSELHNKTRALRQMLNRSK